MLHRPAGGEANARANVRPIHRARPRVDPSRPSSPMHANEMYSTLQCSPPAAPNQKALLPCDPSPRVGATVSCARACCDHMACARAQVRADPLRLLLRRGHQEQQRAAGAPRPPRSHTGRGLAGTSWSRRDTVARVGGVVHRRLRAGNAASLTCARGGRRGACLGMDLSLVRDVDMVPTRTPIPHPPRDTPSTTARYPPRVRAPPFLGVAAPRPRRTPPPHPNCPVRVRLARLCRTATRRAASAASLAGLGHEESRNSTQKYGESF